MPTKEWALSFLKRKKGRNLRFRNYVSYKDTIIYTKKE